MKWWPGWDFTKSPFEEGQIFDTRTYGGIIRGAIFFSLWLWGLWHMDDFFAWQGVKGYENGIPPRQQLWHRMVTTGIAIGGYVSALCLAIFIFIDRRKLKKRTEGQWYDNQNLSKRDLEQGDSEAGEGDGPEAKG